MLDKSTHTRLCDATTTEQLYCVTGCLLRRLCSRHLQERDLSDPLMLIHSEL